MIIPVRCFNCGKVIGNKWNYYKKKCEEMDKELSEKEREENYVHNFDKGFKYKFLDDLGLKRPCCRKHLLAHVDLIDQI